MPRGPGRVIYRLGPVDIVQVAQRIADDVLFPAALATDASDVLPRELLDALAGGGLYGVVAPPQAGGAGADFPALCAVQEALAGGCLTTAFVWAQHNGLVRALAEGGDPELTARWLAPLARGEIRAGVALAGMLPRPPLWAGPDAGGWRLDGVAPFVSGWVASTSSTWRPGPATRSSGCWSTRPRGRRCAPSGSSWRP